MRPKFPRGQFNSSIVATDARTPAAELIDPFAAQVLTRGGVDARAYRAKPIERRIAACLRQLRAADTSAAQLLLERSPELFPSALDVLLIGVTTFFRDTPVFEALRADVLPELLRGRSGLNVYAAGVSGGHELYSVAMLLDELGAFEGSAFVGADCRPRAIAQARVGRFDRDDVAGLTREQQERYFSVAGNVVMARPRLRSRMVWRCLDLLSCTNAPASQDLILFRNVAIYLEPTAAAQAYKSFASQLSPGGILVTGKAEHPPSSLPFVRVMPSIFRKT